MNLGEGAMRLAKGHARRAALLLELRRRAERGADAGAGVDELALAVGLHANTAREHLVALVLEGLVIATSDLPAGRGRPRTLYAAAPEYRTDAREGAAPEHDARDSLLRILIHAHGQDEAQARLTTHNMGVEWGRALRRVATGLDPAASPRAVVVSALESVGMESTSGADSPVIDIGACPIVDLARDHPELICGIHGAMLEGYCGEVGPVTLEPFTGPLMCRVRLGAPAHSRPVR